jgi:hypothetical protein
MVSISLVPALVLLYFYVSTFRSMCALLLLLLLLLLRSSLKRILLYFTQFLTNVCVRFIQHYFSISVSTFLCYCIVAILPCKLFMAACRYAGYRCSRVIKDTTKGAKDVTYSSSKHFSHVLLF